MEQFIKNMTPTQACFILAVCKRDLHMPVSYLLSHINLRYQKEWQHYSKNAFQVYNELNTTARKVYYNAKRAKLHGQRRQEDVIHYMVTKARHNSLVRPTIPFLLAKGFKFIPHETVYRVWFDAELGLEIDCNFDGTELALAWNLIGKDEEDYQFCQMLPSNKLTVNNINQLLNIIPYDGET